MRIFLFQLGSHPLWTWSDGHGGTTTYYYYDAITWAVAGLVVAWVIWMLVRRYLRRQAMRRKPERRDHRRLRQIVKFKNELSSSYLRPGFSANAHAVGIGVSGAAGDYCIQVFVRDAGAELAPGSPALPPNYRGVPLVLIEMPAAGFLSKVDANPVSVEAQFPPAIRDRQETIIGGISGANTNLTGESGTIGFFCTRKSLLNRRKTVHLLSNSHVFADLRKTKADAGDLILQPSPGEPGSNRPVGTLVNFSPLQFDSGVKAPNYIDAAIAKLWNPAAHQPLIPMVGSVAGYARKRDVRPGETARKFGRTTGYTEGRVLSIYLDIWIRYDRTGQSAFFKDQLLLEPTLPLFMKFVAKGDSGSLVVDSAQHALGLIFAGKSEVPDPPATGAKVEAGPIPVPRVEGYGVANPISEVLDRMKIDLIVGELVD